MKSMAYKVGVQDGVMDVMEIGTNRYKHYSQQEQDDWQQGFNDGSKMSRNLRRKCKEQIAKEVEKMTQDNANIKEIVDDYSWHGSWFPKSECFDKLKHLVPLDKHDELKKAIALRAEEYNNTLE